MRHWLIPLVVVVAAYASAWITRVAGLLLLAAAALLWHAERMRAPGNRVDREVLPLPLKRAREDTSDAQLSPELEALITLVVRDFIRAWHTNLSRESDAFPQAAHHLLQVALDRFIRRARHIDISRVIVSRIIPAVRTHIELFFRATSQMRLLHAHMADEACARDLFAELQRVEHFLPRHYHNGVLHAAVGNLSSVQTRETEHAALRRVAERLLRGVLPPGATGPISWALLREVLGCAVLFPIVDLATSTDMINNAIAGVAEAAVQRYASVERVRASLEQKNSIRSPETPRATRGVGTEFPPRSTHRAPRSLSALLMHIGATNSLIEARRIRSDIVLHMQRAQAQRGESDRRKSYLSKLERALAAADARIELLGRAEHPDSARLADVKAALDNVQLEDIISSPSGLSYFMEFMERRKRDALVRFWVMVNSFKNPLEDVDHEFGDKIDVDMLRTLGDGPKGAAAETAELKDALRMIVSVYYGSPIVAIRPQYVRVAHEFLELGDRDATARQRDVVRQSVLCAQTDVFEHMCENDYDAFKESALFLQALGRAQSSATSTDTTTPALDDWSDHLSSDSGSRFEQSDIEVRPSTRIPQQYGFLMGAGRHGGSSDDDGRRSLFGNDTLFDNDTEDAVEADDMIHESIIDGTNEGSTPRALRTRNSTGSLQSGHKCNQTLEAASRNNGLTPEATPSKAQSYAARIKSLEARICKLKQHNEQLSALIAEGEPPGKSTDERVVLVASRNAIDRDLRQAIWEHEHLERKVLEVALSASLLRVSIDYTGVQSDGRNYVAFHIRVETSEGAHTVVRRYSEFRKLHQSLKQRYPQTRTLDSLFPGRRLVGLLNASFIESRRCALERYLQALIQVRGLERCGELRSFLSSAAISTKESIEPSTDVNPLYDVVVHDIQGEEKTHTSHFTEPICDLIIELFDLRQRVDWLRRRAIVLVLQSVLGGTIERWLRDSTALLVSELNIKAMTSKLTSMLWPDGARFQSRIQPVPTAYERQEIWLRMHHALHALVPAYAESIVGRDRAKSGARKLVLIVQNQRLNKHLAYTIIDILVDELLQPGS